MHCVLVVDDEDMTRATFGMALRHHGMRVWEARNVVQARELIAAFSFSAILCDVLLPDGDGEEVLEAVKQKNPETPVIMMTGYPTDRSRSRSHQLKAYAYLKKPVTIQTVVKLLRQALGDTGSVEKHPVNGRIIPNTDGVDQVYPVPLTLEERELISGMVMHQLIQLEDYNTPHAREGKRLLKSILKKTRSLT